MLIRALRLRCPRCGEGWLFRGLFRMHDACSACGASFAREQGFYLGSIYINYGFTVIGTGALYALLVLGLGWSHAAALGVCLGAAVVFPIWFFRWARSLLLALDGAVNQQQAAGADPAGGTQALAGDDARAGCAMGVALALILLFGIGMAVVTILFAANASAAEVLPTVGGIERLDPRFDELVPHDAVIEVLAMGFDWAEGPVWMPASGDREACLLFSDRTAHGWSLPEIPLCGESLRSWTSRARRRTPATSLRTSRPCSPTFAARDSGGKVSTRSTCTSGHTWTSLCKRKR